MRLVCLAAATVLTLVAQDVPRAEYPQPQFQREQWLSLNGRWDFDFDDRDQGLQQDWAAPATHKFTRNITVPFCFESKLSGIADTSFHPIVWYHRTFQTPAAWSGKRVLLHFGAVDYRAAVWVNGRAAGAHEGGNVPFGFDVTPFLKSGANQITLRVEDPPTDRYIPRGKQYWEPKSRGIFYTRTTGIWQPVWLEAAGQSWLDNVKITPSLDGNVRFEAYLQRPEAGVEFWALIRDGQNVISSAMSVPDGPRAVASAFVQNRRTWSLNNPSLYDVTFELRRNGNVVDHVTSYFGFRSVAVEGGRVTLNGSPVYLKFVLDQGYWPESTLTPPSDEAIQYDIRITKEMGFNGARKHQKLEDPRFLYWADKMGFLVSSEMANAYLYDDSYVERFTREWTEAVRRDYNHPSVIMWVPINESWGTPNLREPRQQDHLRGMYDLTKSLDPTRLVIDNDGWEHTEKTDLFAIHDYTAYGEQLEAKYRNVKLAPGAAIPDNSRKALAPGNQYNGTPLYLSEFGGISYLKPGQMAPEGAWGYSGLMKDENTAFARMESLWNAIAKLPFVGICYTQLTDVEQEVNGLMTYDRKPKFDVKKVRELNERLH